MKRRKPSNVPKAKEDAPVYGRSDRFRFVDLFCGIGGFRIAFERAGCECAWSCDWDKHAQKTYEENFGERPFGDIHSIGVADIPPHDILCAGFPCQPFSIAGVSKKLSRGKSTDSRMKSREICFSRSRISSNSTSPVHLFLKTLSTLSGTIMDGLSRSSSTPFARR